MDRITLNDLTNENAYTYAQMLRKYKDKINEIIAYVTNITPDYQHTIEMYYDTGEGEGFTFCFTIKNNDNTTYDNLEPLVRRYANDGVRFTASGMINLNGETHIIDYIVIDDVELGIGFVETNDIGASSSYLAFSYEDLNHSGYFHINDDVHIV